MFYGKCFSKESVWYGQRNIDEGEDLMQMVATCPAHIDVESIVRDPVPTSLNMQFVQNVKAARHIVITSSLRTVPPCVVHFADAFSRVPLTDMPTIIRQCADLRKKCQHFNLKDSYQGLSKLLAKVCHDDLSSTCDLSIMDLVRNIVIGIMLWHDENGVRRLDEEVNVVLANKNLTTNVKFASDFDTSGREDGDVANLKEVGLAYAFTHVVASVAVTVDALCFNGQGCGQWGFTYMNHEYPLQKNTSKCFERIKRFSLFVHPKNFYYCFGTDSVVTLLVAMQCLVEDTDNQITNEGELKKAVECIWADKDRWIRCATTYVESIVTMLKEMNIFPEDEFGRVDCATKIDPGMFRGDTFLWPSVLTPIKIEQNEIARASVVELPAS